MRKSSGIVLFFIFILALGGMGFFFGWAQLTVPPGSYGVVRSKTHGVDSAVIREGEFRWVWYKLIPTNATVMVFSPKRVDQTVRITGSLPSGDIYRVFGALNTDFSWELSASVSFSINPGALPALVEKRGVSGQDDLEGLERTLTGEIGDFLTRRVALPGENSDGLESLFLTGNTDRLERETAAAFPDIENVRLTLKAVKSPDFAQYRTSRALHEEYLEKQRELVSRAVPDAAVKNLNLQGRLEELTRLGELLTKYPVLLQYLSIENGGAGSR
jgi:hypothetical protein